jgi:hypothetical protein
MDEELIDHSETIKEQRGKTLPVLCILSWISLGFIAIFSIISVFSGPKSEEQLMEEKIELLSSLDENAPPEVKMMYEDVIRISKTKNDYHWHFVVLDLVYLTIGFFAVLMMWRLRKTGFYLYLVYSLIPFISAFIIMDGPYLIAWSFLIGIFTLLFIILYTVQLKRMS